MGAGIPRLSASTPSEDIVASLQEHGATIVEGVLSPDLLTRFNAEIEPILERVSPKRPYLNPAIDFFFAGFCGGDRFLEAVVERYGGEADNGLLARACDGARWMAAQYVIDGVRMERPEYLAQGIAALARLGLL